MMLYWTYELDVIFPYGHVADYLSLMWLEFVQ